jgi:hypothetical protein
MNLKLRVAVGGVLFFSSIALANAADVVNATNDAHVATGANGVNVGNGGNSVNIGNGSNGSNTNNGSNVDAVVTIPPQVWEDARNAAASSASPCHRCCVYQNQSYSAGAVINASGVVLQCTHAPNVVGTNPLMWVRLNK